MEFALRLFFSGMIAFVISPDRTEMTILMLQTHGHTPVLAARAGGCAGQCTPRDLGVARVLFPDKSDEQAADALEAAVLNGSAMLLANSELSVQTPGGGSASLWPQLTLKGGRPAVDGVPVSLPSDATQRAAFSFVPDIRAVLPSFGEYNPQLFASRPPQGLVAARLRLKNGTFSTAKLARIGGKVKPVGFRPLAGEKTSSLQQAVATIVSCNVVVTGDAITFTATNFDDGSQRSMTLSPTGGVVEAALVNLPPIDIMQADQTVVTPPPAAHWGAYYDLAANPAPAGNRPIPYVPDSVLEADYDVLHPRAELFSPLLEKLRFGITRGVHDPILCPMHQGGQP